MRYTFFEGGGGHLLGGRNKTPIAIVPQLTLQVAVEEIIHVERSFDFGLINYRSDSFSN